MLRLDPLTTALVLIDLQNSAPGRPLLPHPASEVMASATELARRFRQAGAAVVMVRACWSPDFGDAFRQPVDKPPELPARGFPSDFAEFPDDYVEPADIIITKRQWSAFCGTGLDLQLRRRGVRTIVLGGTASDFGVESTACDAWELGYEFVIVEDATTSRSGELGHFCASSAAISFKRG